MESVKVLWTVTVDDHRSPSEWGREPDPYDDRVTIRRIFFDGSTETDVATTLADRQTES